MLAERFTAQLLAGEPARDPVAVAERLLAVQGQDPRGVRLAIRARTVGLSVTDVEDVARFLESAKAVPHADVECRRAGWPSAPRG